ncbi:SgcJ/EcaC family oxidoreductase [Streptomonospora sp. S1-112]|uniref:SgcJ/EcaC family oxidoreductase n=1 Tax=Streptomonospora mangrovi TaxID=2883123 RepID=A0A9X3SFV7_9ACTN|nr:SgcJ/EcaC family oxidoreductase [Streptomonospora mangrovi]MDA0563384.1 SgcJ/EcaC family oxidoreductase [Streptomonospora mangrovi]
MDNAVTATAAAPARDADIAALTEVVAAVEHAQNNELPEEFIGLFRADAVWTTGHGKLLVGRDAIAAFTRQVLPGAFGRDGSVTFEVAHVLFLRPDVAAVKVRQRYYTRRRGEPELDSEGTPLFVMTKEDGRWLLTACQNTVVHDA